MPGRYFSRLPWRLAESALRMRWSLTTKTTSPSAKLTNSAAFVKQFDTTLGAMANDGHYKRIWEHYLRHPLRTRAWLASLVLVGAGNSPAQTPPPQPSFVCAQAHQLAEQLVCTSAQASQADRTLQHLYLAVIKKAKGAKGRARLRAEQLHWLRTKRNTCTDLTCLLTAYNQRNDTLTQRNNQVLDLTNSTSTLLLERQLTSINDSVVLRGLTLTPATSAPLAIELETDLRDARGWTGSGPSIEMRCTEPGRREGYAGEFTFHTRAHGLDFQRVQRHHGDPPTLTYRMAVLTPGTDIPLNKEARCAIGLSEWLLDHPSTLRILRD